MAQGSAGTVKEGTFAGVEGWRRWSAPTSATKPAGSRLFYDSAGSPDKTLKLYDGHIDRETVMSDITGWIDARLPRA